MIRVEDRKITVVIKGWITERMNTDIEVSPIDESPSLMSQGTATENH